MKILLTGAAGYVGTIVRRHLVRNHDVTGVDMLYCGDSVQFVCDLADTEAVKQLAQSVAPDVVIHAAGNKNIRFCQEHPHQAFRINAEAVDNVARAFGATARIIYISTDYVFDGQKGGYTENDSPLPQTIYGHSKLRGEEDGRRQAGNNFVTIRLSALYDALAAFPLFIHQQLSQLKPIECFSDVIYSPTYFGDFLHALDQLLAATNLTGPIYHFCGEPTTRYCFARIYAEVYGFDAKLVKESSAADSGNYLFPDLSLNGDWSQHELKIKNTGIREALTALKKKNE